jgi:hypothetical protein
MKLTIEQLSKLTKLSIPTLRVYVSRQKLGTKVGNKRMFTQADVQKLLKVSKKSPGKSSKSPARKSGGAKKSPPAREPAKTAVARPATARPAADKARASGNSGKTVKSSFWARLFGGRKQKAKVSLMDAKTTR